MRVDDILEILEKYKLRIPPNVFYELKADICNHEEYKEPTPKNDCAERNGCITCSLDDGDDCCRKLYEESMQEPTTKKDLAVAESISMDVLNKAIDHVEDYVCNHVKDHSKAQGMCYEITIIEEYIKEQTE